MQAERHLNDAELSPAELAEMTEIGHALRAELDRAADLPEHSWIRQQARMKERLGERILSLRWPIAAMAVLAALSFALLSIKAPAPPPSQAVQSADADDLLLRDIQRSLSHRVPEPLMPASVLVQEITTNTRNDEKREN